MRARAPHAFFEARRRSRIHLYGGALLRFDPTERLAVMVNLDANMHALGGSRWEPVQRSREETLCCGRHRGSERTNRFSEENSPGTSSARPTQNFGFYSELASNPGTLAVG